MSARPLSAPVSSGRAPRARRSRGPAVPVLAASLVLAPALVFAPAAWAGPDEGQFPAPSGPSQMPFGEQGAENRDGGAGAGDGTGLGDELPRKAENLGGSVLEEVIDLSTGILKCGINLVTDSVSCPL
ncbi:MAG TPA: hypothetical protein VK083_22070 [Nocardia sp.]|uniref:hypothetical protein n=1 Tax=Nocardia sp. TaxID=1821 RepID=UPI002B4B8558|nr:hypothetical protein [Nocardia sp.]HLS79476.1 hypothetical protein [Nocardia sp.]